MNKLLIEKALAKCIITLDINLPEVMFNSLENVDISAIFNPSSYSIMFNKFWVDSANPIEIFVTTCHEFRHAYQYSQIKLTDASKEDSEVIKKWEMEFNYYRFPSDNRFLTQEIEIDAIAFAHFMTMKYLDVKTVVPIDIKGRVIERVIQIRKTLEG